jgi:glutamate synthase domain-containing protein 3
MLNQQYVVAAPLGEEDQATVQALLQEQVAEAGSPTAEALLAEFDPRRFVRVATRLQPEALE